MTVGTSPRTPMKHDLLWSLVAKENGVIHIDKHWLFRSGVYQTVDLCAGCGDRPAVEKLTKAKALSSPSIFFHHANWLLTKAREDIAPHVSLVEKAQNTSESLKQNVLQYCGDVDYCIHDCNASDIDLNTFWHPQVKAAFILNDPNTVIDFALTGPILDSAPTYTTTLSTLGCNPRGIKRLSRDQRTGWFERIQEVVNFVPAWHDAMIVKLNRDEAQWAYLLTGPLRWFDDETYQKTCQSAFSAWRRGIALARYKTEGRAFMEICEELFLTKKELAGGRNE